MLTELVEKVEFFLTIECQLTNVEEMNNRIRNFKISFWHIKLP